MKTPDIPMIQESLHLGIINEDNAHCFLWYQGYCSLWIRSTKPNNEPSLLYENIEV